MSDEARSMWEAFITAPENAALLKRYAKSAKEPAPLFESIGEDLASSNEEVRNTAFWALVTAMPELTNILHERETRQPGWRDVEGKDQQMVNRGADILTYLHRKLVKEHRFKTRDGYGKDPRPYLKKAISNRKIDVERKRRNRDNTLREVPLDYEASLEIPDSTDSVEDRLIIEETFEERLVEERLRELRAWGFFRSDNELALFKTVHVDRHPFAEVRERFGIPSDNAIWQRLSRANKNIVAVRDELLTFLIITVSEFAMRGKIPRFFQNPGRSEWWAERARRSVQPGVWLNGKAADGENVVAIRPLTTGLRKAPAHIYLVATHKDKEGFLQSMNNVFLAIDDCNLDHVYKLIDPASREIQRSCYDFCSLGTYPTELPGLNKALVEIRGDYIIWLVSNSIPNSIRVAQWLYGETVTEFLLRDIQRDKLQHLTYEELDRRARFSLRDVQRDKLQPP